MSDQMTDLDTMTCAELLHELARLASEGDHLNAEVGTPDQATAQQGPQVTALVDTRARMDKITQLIKDKNCDSA